MFRRSRAAFLCIVISCCSQVIAQTWVVELDKNQAELQSLHDTLVPLGYRPVMVAAHDSPGGVRYQSAWTTDGVSDWAWTYATTSADYGLFSSAQSSMGRRPVCVSASGNFPNEQYAAVWVNDGVTQWQALRQMTNADYTIQLSTMTSAGYRPFWVTATGTGANTRYAALWIGDGRTKCEQHAVSANQFTETVTNSTLR